MMDKIYAKRYLLLLFGVACTAFAPFCIRESSLHPVVLVAYRCLISAMVLAPLFYYQLKKNPDFEMRDLVKGKGIYLAVFLPAFFFFAELVVWNIGVRSSPLVNASMLINLMPLAMPFMLWIVYRASTTKREKISTGIAMAGLLILFYTDLNLSTTYLYGDIMCFFGMIFLTAYLCLGRKFAGLPSIFLYIFPLYLVTGLLALVTSVVYGALSGGYAPAEYIPQDNYQWGVVIGLALVPTVIGHTILNKSMQSLRGQSVAVVNVLHPVFAGIVGYFFYHEVPGGNFFIAAALVFTGIWLVVTADDKLDLPSIPKTQAA